MAYDLPIEIMTIILSNLVQTDLLKCRLVNQSWNRECLVVFRKSNFKTHLNIRQDGGNANKYIEFASTNNPQLVLPIHLSLGSSHLPHAKSLKIVASLQRLFGPDCIETLSLDIGGRHEEDNRTVMTLLTDISHTLKTSLHTLKIYKYKREDRQIIVSILESLAKTLKSLTIGVIIDKLVVVADTMLQFPHLPHLEYLKLCLCYTARGSAMVGLNCDDMNLNSQTFPSLKLLRLPFTFSLRNGSPLASVKTLILLVLGYDRNPYINSDFSIQENFENLRRIFPNATTVSLKQGIPDKKILHSRVQSKFQCKTVLKQLITSELAPRIHQIHIDGASTNILGEILEQFFPQPQIMMTYSAQRNYEAEALIQKAFGLLTAEFGIKGIHCNDEGAGSGIRVVFKEECQSIHKMTNVKKIKLVFRGDEYYDGEKFSDLQLNLMSMAKSLPSLTEIKLIGIKRELYLKQFDDLAIEYPNLLLRVTKLGPKKQYGKQ